MNLVYFGAGAFGLPTLDRLAEHHRLLAVVTQPDRPAGRGKSMTPTPVGARAAEIAAHVPLLKPASVNEADMAGRLRSLGAEAWVVIAFGQKLSRALLDGIFAINLHASLLPRWRGAAPINAAILAGDAETGNSVITLADRMDAGLVLGQSRRPIEPSHTAGDLHDLLASDGPALVERVLADRAAGTLEMVQQDESQVTLAPKLSAADRWVDFRQPAEQCRRRVHGLTPWPGVSADLDGLSLKLLRAQVVEEGAESVAGKLVDRARGVVACGAGTALRLLEVQPAGRRPMSWADFARGRSIPEGATLDGGRAPC